MDLIVILEQVAKYGTGTAALLAILWHQYKCAKWQAKVDTRLDAGDQRMQHIEADISEIRSKL